MCVCVRVCVCVCVCVCPCLHSNLSTQTAHTVALEGRDNVKQSTILCAHARLNGATVDHHRGAVQASHSHESAGHVLVAACVRVCVCVCVRAPS
jgi:hypothetical protein